jgi:hypothetical protein
MTFRFLRKRWSSGSSEKFQYELDKSRSNKSVLKIEDKQTVTYVVSQGTSNPPPGVSLLLINSSYAISYNIICSLLCGNNITRIALFCFLV